MVTKLQNNNALKIDGLKILSMWAKIDKGLTW